MTIDIQECNTVFGMSKEAANNLFLDQSVNKRLDKEAIYLKLTNDYDSFSELKELVEDLIYLIRDEIYFESFVDSRKYGNYKLLKAERDARSNYLRPINNDLFIENPEDWKEMFDRCTELIQNSSKSRSDLETEYDDFLSVNGFNKVFYTAVQSIGCGLDILGGSQASRKNLGQRFESVILNAVSMSGLANKEMTVDIDINDTDSYSCQMDGVISPFDEVKTSKELINSDELVISIKSTSKDRMTKIFADRMLLNKFSDDGEINLSALFLHDVQRSGDKVATTFVANNFYIYQNYLTQLNGVFFVDPPGRASDEKFEDHIGTFEDFFLEEMWDELDMD